MSDRTQGSVRTGSRTGETASAQLAEEPDGTRVAAPADGTAPVTAVPVAPATGTTPTGSVPRGAATLTKGPAAPTGAGPSAGAVRQPTGKTRQRSPRRARLQLRHIDTWSTLKISLVLSIAMFFIWMVAVGILYGVLSGLGVWDTLNDLFGQLGTASGGTADGDVITSGVVFGGAALVGAINIVLMTALCTVAAFIYNLCADLVGGLEVTLSERD